jgi:hypothetical protein
MLKKKNKMYKMAKSYEKFTGDLSKLPQGVVYEGRNYNVYSTYYTNGKNGFF